MDPVASRFEFRCPNCQRSESFSFDDLCNILRDKGFLRRQAEPSRELVQEIVQSCVRDGLWQPCSHCGTHRPIPSLETKPELEADADWGDTIYCEVCKAPIPPERVELFPDNRRCVKCQGKVSNSEVEYCRHCGDILQMKLISRGVTAYRSYCPSCRKTF